MSQSKPVSYTNEELELIGWAQAQPGGFSKTVKKGLRLLRSGVLGDDALAHRVAEQVLAKLAVTQLLARVPPAQREPGKVDQGLKEDFEL